MMKALSIAATAAAALVGAGSRTASRPAPVPTVLEVPSPELRDVAVAVYHPDSSVIYYNPRIMARFGPELSAFFMAHERGHIALRHTRSAALRVDVAQRDLLLQLKELEADCYAARSLADVRPGAVHAAVKFFSQTGEGSFDSEHPSGARRAARILACLPANRGTR